jgi:hypothetical protein
MIICTLFILTTTNGMYITPECLQGTPFVTPHEVVYVENLSDWYIDEYDLYPYYRSVYYFSDIHYYRSWNYYKRHRNYYRNHRSFKYDRATWHRYYRQVPGAYTHKKYNKKHYHGRHKNKSSYRQHEHKPSYQKHMRSNKRHRKSGNFSKKRRKNNFRGSNSHSRPTRRQKSRKKKK